MGKSKWPVAMTRGRSIQVVHAGLIGVSGAFPVTRCHDFVVRKEGTFPIKGGLTDRGNLLFGTFFAVEGIDGGATFRLGCCVMSTKKGFEKLFRCLIDARHSIATARRLIQQPQRPTVVSTLGFPIAAQSVLHSALCHRNALAAQICQDSPEAPRGCRESCRTSAEQHRSGLLGKLGGGILSDERGSTCVEELLQVSC